MIAYILSTVRHDNVSIFQCIAHITILPDDEHSIIGKFHIKFIHAIWITNMCYYS